MGLIDNLRNGIVSWLVGGATPEAAANTKRSEDELQLRAYFAGLHRPQIKVKAGQADDNVTLNFSGLIVDRAVSRLFGAPVTFDLPGEETTKQDDVLAEIWDANKQGILLHKVAQFGAIYGTCFVKIVPDGVESRKEDGKLLPRLVVLNPLYMRMMADPLDVERVIKYVLEFGYQKEDGDREFHREVTQLEAPQSGGGEDVGNRWTVTHYIMDKGEKWQPQGKPETWPYEFAPILAWQNLPLADSLYGQSEIEGVLSLQDRINFTEGNISRIIRYHAHPKTWYRGASLGENAQWGADEMIGFRGDAAEVHNLEMNSDLASSRAFGLDLRQAFFDITRTVDISSIMDKIGVITNLGLRLIYKDELDKLASKQLLYGDALAELNRRLLILSGFEGAEADGGKVIWGNPLPIDEVSEATAAQTQLGLGIVSKETIAGELGRDWAIEQERLAKEQGQSSNIGAQILRTFNRGGPGAGA